MGKPGRRAWAWIWKAVDGCGERERKPTSFRAGDERKRCWNEGGDGGRERR